MDRRGSVKHCPRPGTTGENSQAGRTTGETFDDELKVSLCYYMLSLLLLLVVLLLLL